MPPVGGCAGRHNRPMTDPGDLAHIDSNASDDLPSATPENVNPGLGGEGKQKTIQNNEKEQGKIATQNPDPLDL